MSVMAVVSVITRLQRTSFRHHSLRLSAGGFSMEHYMVSVTAQQLDTASASLHTVTASAGAVIRRLVVVYDETATARVTTTVTAAGASVLPQQLDMTGEASMYDLVPSTTVGSGDTVTVTVRNAVDSPQTVCVMAALEAQ